MVNRGVFHVPPDASGGGAETHAYNLSNHLADRDTTVDFVTRIGSNARFASFLRIHEIFPKRGVIPPKVQFSGWVVKHLLANLLAFATAARVIVKQKASSFDVIHCHGGLSCLLISIFFGQTTPVVYTAHDPSPWMATYKGKTERIFRKLAYLSIEVPCFRLASRIVCVNPSLKREMRRWGVADDKLVVLPSGTRSVAPYSPGRSESPYYGLFVGQLVPRKGVETLVKAFAKVTNKNLRLVIVGDGPERKNLMRLREDLQIESTIEFPGYVEEEKLAALHKQAAFFVFPSLAEGFSLALLNAASYGLPLVVSNASAGGLELVDRENCLLFPGSNIAELARLMDMVSLDNNLRDRLSLGALEFAKRQMSWSEVARKMKSVYASLGG
jgi:glycosyltransferase involved in cell wall biosynthesis